MQKASNSTTVNEALLKLSPKQQRVNKPPNRIVSIATLFVAMPFRPPVEQHVPPPEPLSSSYHPANKHPEKHCTPGGSTPHHPKSPSPLTSRRNANSNNEFRHTHVARAWPSKASCASSRSERAQNLGTLRWVISRHVDLRGGWIVDGIMGGVGGGLFCPISIRTLLRSRRSSPGDPPWHFVLPPFLCSQIRPHAARCIPQSKRRRHT